MDVQWIASVPFYLSKILDACTRSPTTETSLQVMANCIYARSYLTRAIGVAGTRQAAYVAPPQQKPRLTATGLDPNAFRPGGYRVAKCRAERAAHANCAASKICSTKIADRAADLGVATAAEAC
jgi:hypothetical protein